MSFRTWLFRSFLLCLAKGHPRVKWAVADSAVNLPVLVVPAAIETLDLHGLTEGYLSSFQEFLVFVLPCRELCPANLLKKRTYSFFSHLRSSNTAAIASPTSPLRPFTAGY